MQDHASESTIRCCPVLNCYLCGTEGELLYQGLKDLLFEVPGIWGLMRCPQCHLVWLNPRPVAADVGKLYKHYHTHDIPPSSRLGQLKKVIQDAVLASYFGYTNLPCSQLKKALGKVIGLIGPVMEMVKLSTMTLSGPPKGRLLDVGCGNGQFLAKMRDFGWEVVGIEPDGKAVKVARERFGLYVYENTPEETSFTSNEFEAVTLNHVIEHLWDPVNVLRECRRVLKPGGKLVAITPNIECLGYRLFQVAWRGLEVPRHLYLFSPRALVDCAEQAGLKVLELRTTARTARWIWAASYLIRRNRALPGGSPQKQALWLRLEGVIFQAVEH